MKLNKFMSLVGEILLSILFLVSVTAIYYWQSEPIEGIEKGRNQYLTKYPSSSNEETINYVTLDIYRTNRASEFEGFEFTKFPFGLTMVYLKEYPEQLPTELVINDFKEWNGDKKVTLESIIEYVQNNYNYNEDYIYLKLDLNRTVETRKIFCVDASKIVKILLDEYKYDNGILVGKLKDKNHMWNYVKVNNEKVMLDSISDIAIFDETLAEPLGYRVFNIKEKEDFENNL